MARADGNRERIAARALDELDDLFRTRVVRLFRRNFVFHAGEHAQFGLDRHVVLVRVVDDLLRELDILVERQGAAVNHDRAETRIDAALARLEAVAMIEVKHDLRILAAEFLGVGHRTLGHVAQNRRVGVLARTLRNLHDDRRLRLDGGLNNRLHLLHRVEVERRNRITALDGLCEHFLGIDETKIFVADHV